MAKGTTEKFIKRDDIPDLKSANRKTIYKFINSHNVRLAVEYEPSSLKPCPILQAYKPSLTQEIELSHP